MRHYYDIGRKPDNETVRVAMSFDLTKQEKKALVRASRALNQGAPGRPNLSKAGEAIFRIGLRLLTQKDDRRKWNPRQAVKAELSIVDARRATSRPPLVRTTITSVDGKVSSYIDKDEDFD